MRHTRDLGSVGEVHVGAESLVGRELADGKLLVEERVGHGGMGVVYRALHKQLRKNVAVKVLHERFHDDLVFVARFQAEALAISALDHPSLVHIVDYGQEPDGTLYLVMEFLEGRALDSVMADGLLTLARILEIGMQISAGLGHAHSRGMVHRDVKPANILLVNGQDDDGRAIDVAKLCDFGIATAAGASDLVGTPAYMSPEQIRGHEIDGRSDVYSLGVVLYELAAGQLPFDSDDVTKVMEQHLHREALPPSLIRTVDPRLESLVMRMLAKEPCARPQSMREVRAELRTITLPAVMELFGVGTGRSDRGRPVVVTNAQAKSRIHAIPVAASSMSMPAFVDPAPLAAQMIAEPMTSLRERLSSVARFTRELESIGLALRLLLVGREFAALSKVLAVFRAIAGDPSDPRAELSMRVVRSLCDPSLLAPLAEHALGEHDENAPAVLAMLGLASAHALYAARVKLPPTSPVRGRFVNAMRGVGRAAIPLLSTVLERNAPGESTAHDPKLAVDLLRSLPAATDDALGAIVAHYLRWGENGVRSAAVPMLASLWQDRARAFLIAVVTKDPDDGVRIAAIRALHALRAFDEHLVRKTEPLLQAESSELRIALAEALTDANPEARGLASEVIRAALLPKGGILGFDRRHGAPMTLDATMALACAFQTLAPTESTLFLRAVARSADATVARKLATLLDQR